MPPATLPDPVKLLRRVSPNLSAALRLKEELNRSLPAPDELRTVSVTRLLNPAQAYYDLVHPVPEEIPAHEKRLAGTGAHDFLERRLALSFAYTEQWLHGEDFPWDPPLDRITAKLDAYEPLPDGRLSPTEIKNVGAPRATPYEDHLEQLGMYCALLGVEFGRLILVQRHDDTGKSTLLPPWRARFPDLGEVRREMVRRRDLLLEAVRRRDPSELPRCPYYYAGCRFRRAGVCDCAHKPPLDRLIARQAQAEEDPEFAREIEERLRAWDRENRRRRSGRPLVPEEVLTPRKAYFRRLLFEGTSEAGTDPDEDQGSPPSPSAGVEQSNLHGLRQELEATIQRAHKGRYFRRRVRFGPAEVRVRTLDGMPFLVKIRRPASAVRPTPAELGGPWGAPEEVWRLASLASLLGTSEARLYLWNARLRSGAEKLQVFDLAFDPRALEQVRDYIADLPGRVQGALEQRRFEQLPLCPSWMCPRCEYRGDCRPDETDPSRRSDPPSFPVLPSRPEA